jgi:hypothetical protein
MTTFSEVKEIDLECQKIIELVKTKIDLDNYFIPLLDTLEKDL